MFLLRRSALSRRRRFRAQRDSFSTDVPCEEVCGELLRIRSRARSLPSFALRAVSFFARNLQAPRKVEDVPPGSKHRALQELARRSPLPVSALALRPTYALFLF